MDDYDVVADALQKHRDRLWDMINRNMNSEYVTLNIMDDIRFYQIERLDAAIAAHKNKKEWVGLIKEEVENWNLPEGATVFEFVQFVEAKLKEKNT